MKYAIKSKEGLFWSSQHGWTDNLNDADMFSYEETYMFMLPMDGEWYMLEEE